METETSSVPSLASYRDDRLEERKRTLSQASGESDTKRESYQLEWGVPKTRYPRLPHQVLRRTGKNPTRKELTHTITYREFINICFFFF